MKRIVLLSDGTGNSSGKVFKTNVWRLYQALDLTPDSGQIAYYDDGVGTSSFRPLALVGGAFGYGLKRNVLDLYEFLCWNWEPGDEIYAFGFSRGAFTIRMLVGLVVSQGLLAHCPDRALAHYTRDAYRQYRRRYKPAYGVARVAVDFFRWLRDMVLRGQRALVRKQSYSGITKDDVPSIRFVGLWDTVSAYGTPVAEVTRGIDDWVWPLSLPDHRLSPKVKAARHALALDDERDTFHPQLWDEIAECEMIARGEVEEGRLRQVWFSGMHADVGGGYPDDALSYTPLAWMIEEAQQADISFRPEALKLLALAASISAPLHDSRKGLGGYYRYQPRKIAARMDLQPRDPTSLVMQDPDPRARALLTKVEIHQSVFDRIRSGPDRYAPLVLPQEYNVVGSTQGGIAFENPAQSQARVQAQDGPVWNNVWRKRVNYFATVGISLLLASAPVWNARWPAFACDAPQCLLSPIFRAAGGLLPGFLGYWTEAFANYPGISVGLMGLIVLLLLRGASLERRIHDGMWAIWAPVRAPAAGPSPNMPALGWGDSQIEWLRRRPAYQRTLQALKWTWMPALVGVTTVLLIMGGATAFVWLAVQRIQVARAERSGAICTVEGGFGTTPARGGAPLFMTDAMCWNTDVGVQEGKAYEVRLTVQEPWLDHSVPASPQGFESSQMTWPLGYLAVPLRRSLTGHWFQPFATITDEAGIRRSQILEFHMAGPAYVTLFTAQASGNVQLWVNDTVLDVGGLTSRFYKNNHGSSLVQIREAEPTTAEVTPERR